MTFNGASLFANYSSPETGAAVESIFRDNSRNHTISIHTSTQGSQGSKISIHQAALLAALTIKNNADFDAAVFSGTGETKFETTNGTANTDDVVSFAAAESDDVWDLDAVSMGVFQKALENISFLRAQVGGGMSRLSFAADSLSVQQTNIRAALGRIEDVDIAEESANLSKYSILTQAAASMVAQANSTNDVALMLLR